MSDDWKVGDLAVFIGGNGRGFGTILPGHSKPVRGRAYRVEQVLIHPIDGKVGLVIPGCYHSNPFGPAWQAKSFRKIRPDEHEDCEPEFVTLLESFKERVRA